MFNYLFPSDYDRHGVAAVYAAIVDQSRQASLYDGGGIPDSVEGRFEALALHAWMVMRVLAAGGKEAHAFSQALFDRMFIDLDMNLREVGVSDVRMSKVVKNVAQHFQGRLMAYEAALAPEADAAGLAAALDRNLFGSTLPEPVTVQSMANYVRGQTQHLASQSIQDVLAGRITFAAAPCQKGAITVAAAPVSARS